MGIEILTHDTSLAVSLEEIKQHISIDGTDYDDMLTSYLYAAQSYVEAFKGKLLTTQYQVTYVNALTLTDAQRIAYDLTEDAVYAVILPYAPIQSIDSVTADGVEVSYENSGKIIGFASEVKNIVVTYTAGYSADEYHEIPYHLLQAIRMLAAEWFRNREANVTGTIITQVPIAVDRLIRL